MENNKELNDLMEEMDQSKQGLKAIHQLIDEVFEGSSVPRQTVQRVSKRMIMELMERVRLADTEEEGDTIVKKFFKDVHNGKITPHEQPPTEKGREGMASRIQLPEMTRETLRNGLNELLDGIEDLRASLERIEGAKRGLEPILRAIGNFGPDKDERMRGMISALLKLGYSGAEIKELTKSGEKYSLGISEMEANDDQPQYRSLTGHEKRRV